MSIVSIHETPSALRQQGLGRALCFRLLQRNREARASQDLVEDAPIGSKRWQHAWFGTDFPDGMGTGECSAAGRRKAASDSSLVLVSFQHPLQHRRWETNLSVFVPNHQLTSNCRRACSNGSSGCCCHRRFVL